MIPEQPAGAESGLKVSVSDVGPARKALAVEVPAVQVASEYEEACRKYSRNLKVPGFRQGKVPPHIIKQRFGREIEQETVEHVIEHAMGDAVTRAGLKPLRAPILKEYRFDPGEPLAFTAEVEVLPPVQVRGRESLSASIREAAVTDRMLTEALQSLQERAARFEPVTGRGLRPGDHAVMDVSARRGDGPEDAFKNDHYLMEVGSGGPHPELTEELREMTPGETREFSIPYPADHPSEDLAGRRVAYTVHLREIKQKVLPVLDDEFARDLGSFGSLDELKSRVEADLRESETRRAREEARSSILKQLLEANPEVPAPEVLVERELDRRVDELARAMARRGMDPNRSGVDWDDIRRNQHDSAARAVQSMILLDAIAEEQKISVDPETLSRTLAEEASRLRQTPEALRAKLVRDGRLKGLEEQLLREKVLDFLLVTANT